MKVKDIMHERNLDFNLVSITACTLEDLSQYITQRGENLLLEILDFLVLLMRYKDENQMDAYHLGEAMGKVTLGPADCDPIIAEKAGHFLTRMIIEHSKKRIHNTMTVSKSEAARAKAKSYNRLIQKIRKRNEDWISIVHIALYAMMEDHYELEPANEYEEPYLSIFSKDLDPSQAVTSPVLFRLVTRASQAIEPTPQDPFAESYLFNTSKKRKAHTVENQIRIAFDDFIPLLQSTPAAYYATGNNAHMLMMNEKTATTHNKKMNFKLMNLKKHKSQEMHDNNTPLLSDSTTTTPPTSASTLETESFTSHSNKTLYSVEDFSHQQKQKNHHVKKMMKKVIKIVPSSKKTTTHIY